MTVTKDMTIQQVLEMDINTAGVFFAMGMHCVGCPSSIGETLEEAAMVHGFDADMLVTKLNENLASKIAAK